MSEVSESPLIAGAWGQDTVIAMYFAFDNSPTAPCPGNGRKVPSGSCPSGVADHAAEIVAEQSPYASRKLKDVRTGPPNETPTDQPAVDIRVYVDYLSPGAREFQLANVQQLADYVDEQLRQLVPGGRGSFNLQRVALLVAIQLADELFREKDLNRQFRERVTAKLDALEASLREHERRLEEL